MKNTAKQLIELNFLGSSFIEDDPFLIFSNSLKSKVLNTRVKKKKINYHDDAYLSGIIEDSLLRGIEGKKVILLLSGGIDSTLLAYLLSKNNVPYESYSYFLNEEDPSLQNVQYVEQHLGIRSNYLFYNKERIRNFYENYFDYYRSLNMDYGALLVADMLSLMDKVGGFSQNTGSNKNFCLVDGVGADDVFGCNTNLFINTLRSWLLAFTSNSFTSRIQFPMKKIDIYTSSLVKRRYAATTYQNFVLSKIIHPKYLTDVGEHLYRISINFDNVQYSDQLKSALFYLYYDGRRSAYKSLGYKDNTFNVHFPFLNTELINYGFSLKNQLKVKPAFKEPLRRILLNGGFKRDFVYSSKVGFGFDLFDVLDREEAIKSLSIINEVIPLKRNAESYIFKLMKDKDKAVDHFLYGLMMSTKLVSG